VTHKNSEHDEPNNNLSPSDNPILEKRHPSDEKGESGNHNFKKTRKLPKPETMTMLFTGIIAAWTVIYSVFAGLQWWEIHSGSSDTHALAVAAKTQAEQSQAQTTKMKESLEKTDNLISRVAEQAKSSNTLASQAKRSTDIAASSMRPWLGMYSFKDNTDATQKPIRPIVIGTLANSGKTPATNVKIKITSAIRSFFDEETILTNIGKGGKIIVTWDEMVIPPNGQRQFPIMTGLIGPDVPLNSPDGLYIVGEITYSDTDNTGVYSTGFCLRNINGSGFVPCFAGHWMK
jgi:hypothetical protein